MALFEGNFQSWFDFNDFRIPSISPEEPLEPSESPQQQLEQLERFPTTTVDTGTPRPVPRRSKSKKMMTEEDLMDQVQMDASHITMKKNMHPYRERQ